MSEEDLRLLITLDDPWNAQECDTFNGHRAEHTDTHLHGQPEPARGRHEHRAEDILHARGTGLKDGRQEC